MRSLIILIATVFAVSVYAGEKKTVDVSSAVRTKISSDIYGVNASWHMVSKTEFPAMMSLLNGSATFARYPGGWVAEHYDWKKNDTPNWKERPSQPGIDPDSIVRQVQTSFVLPTSPVIKGNMTIRELVGLYRSVASQYGPSIKRWEIGNEWWLQSGAKKSDRARQKMMKEYAEIVRVIAPVIKSADPDSVVFATMDWKDPQQAGDLKRLVGDAWRSVDGISIHPYCGDETGRPQCGNIGEAVAEIRSLSGKQPVFASEWAATRKFTGDEGLAAANSGVEAIVEMALAGLDSAAYWPPAGSVPSIALVNEDFKSLSAVGLVFEALSRNYRGQAITPKGDLPVAAAIQDDGSLNLIIPSMGSKAVDVSILLPAGGWKIVSAEKIQTDKPMKVNRAQKSSFPATVRGENLTFSLNDNGAGWEVAIITLRR